MFANRLLMMLPDECRRALACDLESTKLERDQQIEERGRPIEYVYFVESGIITSVSSRNSRVSAGVGMIGLEGMSGSAIALGDDIASLRSFVQSPGRAARMTAVAFRTAMEQNPALHRLISKYCRVLWIQAVSTGLANLEVSLVQRVARWMLMTHDRVEKDEIAVTHAFLSIMLHVRRPGVTNAIHVLEGEGLVTSTRGMLEIRDRLGLIEFTAGSYGLAEAEYQRLIG